MQASGPNDRDQAKMEQALDSFEPAARRRALDELSNRRRRDRVPFPDPQPVVNLHAHTFFSYNPYGYSPSHFAWLAKTRGLKVAGIVDFDVLDGLDEFLHAGAVLELPVCVGLESRVFVQRFADRVITSPGEPGISYYMGVGFTTTRLAPSATGFLSSVRRSVEQRNRALVERVNAYTRPVVLDYDRDVLPLTPSGNATERHICLAYARGALRHFGGSESAIASFWSEKLGEPATAFDLPDGAKLQALIRAKTMKRGGVGYVQPDGGSFPSIEAMSRFVLDAQAIPVMTWLDGTSDGEQAIDELLDTAVAAGAAALNIIPDRNFTPGVKDRKLKNLHDIAKLACERHLPVVVGTEMNSPGLKFVDDFDSAELAPLRPVFLRGAHIMYAHSALQRWAGAGYLSEWALKHFPGAEARNAWFEEFGRCLRPKRENALAAASGASMSPDKVLQLACSE